MIRDLVIKEFKMLLEENKRNIVQIVKVALKANLNNEQYYLDWEDFLNKISTGDYSELDND